MRKRTPGELRADPRLARARAPADRTGRFVVLLVLLTATVGAAALFWPDLRARFARRPPEPPPAAQLEVAPVPRETGAPVPPVPPVEPPLDVQKLVGVWKRQSGTGLNAYWEFWADGTNEVRSDPAPGLARRPFTVEGSRIFYDSPKDKANVTVPASATVLRVTDDELLVRAQLGTEVRYARVRPVPKPKPEVTEARLLGAWQRTLPSTGVTWEFTKAGYNVVTTKGAPVALPFTIKGETIHTPKSDFVVVRLTETELVVKQKDKDLEQVFRRAPKDKPKTAKDVMSALHGPSGLVKPLEAAVLKPDWPAARPLAGGASDLAAALAKSAPPKGTAASWDKLTGAHAQAARDLLTAVDAEDAAKARIHLSALKRSCAECHKAHK